MKRFLDYLIVGAGLAFGACFVYFILWPWVRSW